MNSPPTDPPTLLNQLVEIIRHLETIETHLAELNAQQQEQLCEALDELNQRRLQKSCSRLDACRRRLHSLIDQIRRSLTSYWRSSAEGQALIYPHLGQLVESTQQFLNQSIPGSLVSPDP